jgi:putative Mg2+ transporter-C (MgtC) family protein
LDEITHILEKNSVKLQNYKFEKNIQKNEIMYDINVKYRDEKTLLFASDDITRTIKEIKSFGLE